MASPYFFYDGARISPESTMGKELAKWERKPDWRPETNPYPKMLYRAKHRPDGKRSVGEVLDHLFAEPGADGRKVVVPGAAEQWNRGCQLTVNNDYEKQRAYEQGWRDTPQEALEYLESRDNIVSDLTAERHYTDARMSEKAQREAAAVDQTTLKQIPSIPETPVKRRGRPRKEQPATE